MTRPARRPRPPRTILLILGLLAAILLLALLVKHDAPPPAPGQSAPTPAPNTPAATASDPGLASRPPPLAPDSPARPALAPVAPSPAFPRSPLADSLNSPATTARDDLRAIARILALYRERFGAYPAFETNAQLVNALAGANPHRIALLPRDASAVSPDTGRLLDRWGTPYDVHALSRDALELRSAGPDRALHTADDLTLPLGGAETPAPAPSRAG